MKVVSYYNVVPTKNKNQEKTDILEKFIKGVKAVGDEGEVYHGYGIQSCDVAMIQGWQHQRGKGGPHLRLRQNVIDYQIQNKKIVCTADSNLFLYANKVNRPHHYLRYSFNGVFPSVGNYFDDNPDPTRWQQISRDLNIRLGNTKSNGSDIVICLQRNGGWSMGSTDVVDWTRRVVVALRQHTDRSIIIRPHPGDAKATLTYVPALNKLFQGDPTVRISLNKPLEEDLKNCWAVVNHNSSSIVGPIIMGYHAYITDPHKSQCAEVAHFNFEQIENPQMFNRQKWLERISMFHWKFSELEDGSAWRHMRQYI